MSIMPPGPDSKRFGPICFCDVNPQPHRHPNVSNALAAAEAWAEHRESEPDDFDCGHHSWAGLMSLLDQHWPEDIFPTREDDIRRDAGARIVSRIRWVDRLRGEG